MVRSCSRLVRGFCFCEYCIKECIQNAYVEAINSPKEPINFKNYKESNKLNTLEIYCKQFGDESIKEELINLEKQSNIENDNQTKFLRILSDNFTKYAVKQAKYFINNPRSLNNSQKTTLNKSTIKSTKDLDDVKLKMRLTRLRSSLSESSSYDTVKCTQSSNATTHCNSSGTLFNTAGLQIKDDKKNRIKFGPEDFLATTHPMLLFGLNSSVDAFHLNKKSNRRRKSSNKKEQLCKSIELSKEDTELKEESKKETKVESKESEIIEPLNNKKSNKFKKLSKNKLSNITNII